ncbi:protein lifeguard 3-like isoform X2 [Erythrolamprus reginae]
METLGPPPPYDDGKKSGAEEGRRCKMEQGDFQIAYWVEKSVRQAFIRKVYSIIILQLLVTVAIVAVFTFVPPVSTYVIHHNSLYYISNALFVICYLMLVLCQKIRRRFPWNIILMTIFTLSVAFMTGTIASLYDTKAVILAMIITTVIIVAVTAFSFQTKVDLTTWIGFFCILAIVFFVTSISTIIVLINNYIYWTDMLYSATCAIIFALFVAYDTQLLLGNKTFSLSPEDYIYGAIQIYVNVIYIFFSLSRLGSQN